MYLSRSAPEFTLEYIKTRDFLESDMSNVVASIDNSGDQQDWIAVARRLAQEFGERAAAYDAEGSFVQENYADLRDYGLFSAGIPKALGGGGAGHADICRIIRELGRQCGSTGLSYAMHSHPVAVNVLKYMKGDEQAASALRNIAANELVIAGTGANDWLTSNGEAIETEGGYLINAHKRFVSGGPGADQFVTSAPFDGPEGQEVLHFVIPFSTDGVEIQSNWDTHGMRGTGSNDVLMKDVFVPTAAVVARRPAGVWHPMWDMILPVALPMIVSCYVGIAETAVEHALASARNKPHLAHIVGEMKNELAVAQLAVDDMLRITNDYDFVPGVDTTDAILTRKTIAASAVKVSVELATTVTGGPGFFRSHPMERIVRDIRAIQFHPLPEKHQQLFSGRIALGLDPVGA
jgi:alkylation response protein AidB-like acyl-CoA dehydrogenase